MADVAPDKDGNRSPRCGSRGPPPPEVSAERVNLEQVIREKSKVYRAQKLEGVEITSEPATENGKVLLHVETLHETFHVKFSIKNNGPDSVFFTYYNVLQQVRCFTTDSRTVTRTNPSRIKPGGRHDVDVPCKLKDYGHFPVWIYFEFRASAAAAAVEPAPGYVFILREMVAATRPHLEELLPVAPYKPAQLPQCQLMCFMATAMGQLCLDPSDPLTMENYKQRFHTLLNLEESQKEKELSKYNLRGRTMTQDPLNETLFILKVAVHERPPEFSGNHLKVLRSEIAYRGEIVKLGPNSVTLKFPKKHVQTLKSGHTLFDVEFTLHPYPRILQHKAVDMAVKRNLTDVLFPSATAGKERPLPRLRMFNKDLDKNPEQCAAVKHIVAGSSKPAPYIVFGPPGTGKTSTLVEAMHQVITDNPSAHIVACAPSNSACDLLCRRLMVPFGPGKVYRVYAKSYDVGNIPLDLWESCNWNETNKAFEFSGKEFQGYQVIVTTLITAKRLETDETQLGHFTHVFVDESGQAVEPACLIPIAALHDPTRGQLVLAGDPKQLGPIVYSQEARKMGFDISLLERLMTQNDLYKTKDDGDVNNNNKRFCVKLLRNYRSHEAILKVPNQLFYDNELTVFAVKRSRETYCRWQHLPKQDFPVIYHNVNGKEVREGSSPSFFNVFEIDVVLDYLTKLMKTQGENKLPKLSPGDIGIITPYNKQAEKIQKALRNAPTLKPWPEVQEIKVGCVEVFQGDERKIILMSTVRSHPEEMGRAFKIGFLSDPKRFNVALTRAGSLLIVVGNATVLGTNPCWKTFIEYCKEQGGFRDATNSDNASQAQFLA